MADRPKPRSFAQRRDEHLDPELIAGCVREFLQWMEVQGYSQASVRGAHYQLRWFCQWCTERNVQRPQDVTFRLLEQYQAWLFHRRKKNDQPLSVRSQQAALIWVRVLFRRLMRRGVLLMNPAAEITLPKVPKRLPTNVLTAKQVEEVMAAVDFESAHGLRDRTILEVLYSTGMRRQELSNLNLDHVDQSRGLVTIKLGKGGKDRVVPIGKRALEWVDRYVHQARPDWLTKDNSDEPALFIGREGFRLIANSVSRLVHEYVEKSGIGKKGSAHMLRHTMATLMLEGGADIRFIQEMLGHSSLASTQVYTHVSVLKLKEVHDATHPAARPGHATGALDEETRAELAKTLVDDDVDDDISEDAGPM